VAEDAAVGSIQDDIKLEAEWLRLCLAYGLRERSAVIAWAENRLAGASVPPAGLVEIVTASDARPQDVMGMLAAVPGRFDRGVARARIFAELADRLRAQPLTLAEIVWRLGRMALNGDAPDEAAVDEIDELNALCSDLDDEAGLEIRLRARALAFLDRLASAWTQQ
jgi:hypothetical protein